MSTTTSLPEILTANTFYWSPAKDAGSRRRNEIRRMDEVASFFRNAGFEVTTGASVIAVKGDLCCEFSYSESTKNVYKRFEVTRNGNKSNITALKKMLEL